jgi:hypothetical protein
MLRLSTGLRAITESNSFAAFALVLQAIVRPDVPGTTFRRINSPRAECPSHNSQRVAVNNVGVPAHIIEHSA